MVATNSMATRSSLELMLDKLQQLDDQPKDIPPALPVRPVSRARLPRARRPLQLDDFQRRNLEENDASLKWSGFEPAKFDHFQKGIKLLEKNSKDITEKRISSIQKCYRGYKVRCYYKELRSGVIALQSFIRGENARRGCKYRMRIKLKAVILIQRQTRKYFEHLKLAGESRKLGLVEDNKDCTQVPNSVLIDLRRRVLRTEAKVREMKDENVALKMKIQEMEEKWKQYEEKMKSLEKTWQDELTNIQECLVAADKNRVSEIRLGQSDSTPRHYLDSTNNSYYRQVDQRELVHIEDSNHHNEVNILHPQDELRKLKLRFKAWKKDYKYKLRDTQSTLKKLANSESAKCQKNWWGRISY